MFKFKLTAMGYDTDTKEWWELFDKHLPKIKWFILEYFESMMPILMENRKLGTLGAKSHTLDILTDIWFGLPDHIFNVKENPDGWTEFLELIED